MIQTKQQKFDEIHENTQGLIKSDLLLDTTNFQYNTDSQNNTVNIYTSNEVLI